MATTVGVDTLPGSANHTAGLLDKRRTIELGVKGPGDSVAIAMAELRQGVSNAGFDWTDL